MSVTAPKASVFKDIFLRGQRVYLRELTPDDASPQYLSWLNNAEITKYLSQKPGLTKDGLRRYIEEQCSHPSSLLLGIFLISGDCHIGNIRMHKIDFHYGTAEIGILVGDQETQGRGIGYESLFLLFKFAFDAVGLRRLTLGAIDGNVRAIRLYEKLGFVLEGRLRGHAVVDGKPVDALRFGLLKEEFFAKAAV